MRKVTFLFFPYHVGGALCRRFKKKIKDLDMESSKRGNSAVLADLLGKTISPTNTSFFCPLEGKESP